MAIRRKWDTIYNNLWNVLCNTWFFISSEKTENLIWLNISSIWDSIAWETKTGIEETEEWEQDLYGR